MRAVVQRVFQAHVEVDGRTVGEIGPGLVVFLGVGDGDGDEDCAYLAEKVASLRVFEGQDGRMNLSVKDTGGGVLCISQFTLYGDCRKGRRPSFTAAAPPDEAEKLYQQFVRCLQKQGIPTATGRFQAMMRILVDNDGPVTLLLDSTKQF